MLLPLVISDDFGRRMTPQDVVGSVGRKRKGIFVLTEHGISTSPIFRFWTRVTRHDAYDDDTWSDGCKFVVWVTSYSLFI